MIRQGWIYPGDAVALVQQCVLAGISRATVYAQQKLKPVDEVDLLHSRLIDEEYTRQPFYGTRRMVVYLISVDHIVNGKRVQRLMRQTGLVGIAPGPNTSRPHPEHKIYLHLLRGAPVVRPNQVWSTDITCIRSDQSSQFTSVAFTSVLEHEGIVISMDGRGRVFDNIFVERLWRNLKYEDVYLKGYATMGELMVCPAEYFAFYNGERPHQSLGDKTPDVGYRTATGGGTMIVDKFGGAGEEPSVPLCSTDAFSPVKAAATTTPKATPKPGQRRFAASEAMATA